MAWIVQQFTSDRGIQLGCEDLVRKLPWGTNWTKMRIGCRVATNGVNSIPDPNYAPVPRMGICTGSTAYIGNTTDAVWWQPIANWSANLLGSNPYQYYHPNGSAINNAFFQKVGDNVGYQVNKYSGGSMIWSANPTGWRTGWFVDFVKSSSSVTNSSFYGPSNVQLVDCTRGNFLASMEYETTPWNTTAISVNTQTLPYRNFSDWDSVHLGWCRSSPTTVFFDLCVVRFY
jgi:hypothetical protein